MKDKKNKSYNLALLIPYMKPYKSMLFGVLISLILTSAAVLFISRGVKIFIDEGITAHNAAVLDQSLFFLLGVIIVLALFTFLRFFLITWTGEKVIADLRKDIYQHMLRLSPGFYEKNSAGEVLAYIVSDTTLLLNIIGSSLSMAMRNIVLFIGGVAMLIFTSKKLTLMILILIPIVIAPIMILGKKLRALSKKSQDKVGELSSISEQTVSAIKTIQAYVREEKEADYFSNKIKDQMTLTLERITLRGLVTMSIITLVFGGIGCILWVGGHQVLDGNITAGELTAFIYISIVCAGAIAALSEVYGEIDKAAGATERIFDFLATKPTIFDAVDAVSIDSNFQGNISFKDVTFFYESNPTKAALKKLSFDILPGKITALVGKSGAGKSTIFMLLERFYDIQDGQILFDETDIKKIKLADLRSQFAYVSQDAVIFSSTAYENILYGKPTATREEVIQAAIAANALEFIEKMPEGFDTFLGEKGVRISGGQKQRIAIARAILNDPKILLLDEATSSLDSENEQLVQKALANLMQGRTTIVIAHRLSTVINADNIIVLDKGKIIESGTHSQLIEKDNGIYKSLAKLQFDGMNGSSS
jgi:ATP-binding cassette, subfamily B, bacterial